MHTQYYETLGVSPTASDKEIKKAFRKLAQQHHPDRNQGDAEAEQRFKAVNRAYDILGDPEKRKLYDEFGEDAEKLGFDGEKARAYRQWRGQGNPGFSQGMNMEDILSQMFGGRAAGRRGPRPGRDVRATLTLDLRTMVLGGERTLQLDGRAVQIRIPPGITDGGTLRLRGKGSPGSPGAPAGDLLLTVNATPDPIYTREGDHLSLVLPITLGEALRGASVQVPTLTGNVKVRVPPGSQTGQTLRLRGRGVQRSGKPAGDFLVRLEVRMPTGSVAEVAEAIDALEACYEEDVRAGLTAEA